jgi:hypothetical protein
VRRTWLSILVASVLLGGCGFSPFGCTEAGCETGVLFTLERDLVTGTEYRVVACVDDRCAEGALEVGPDSDGTDGALSLVVGTDVADSIFYRLDERRPEGEHRISLTVHAADGELLVDWEGTAEFERVQPNGPWCEPTCWLAEVTV